MARSGMELILAQKKSFSNAGGATHTLVFKTERPTKND
jgi:hypothetical protein